MPILASSSPTWNQFGAILGHLGLILGPSWAILSPSWASVGPLLGHLGQSWGRLGATLGRLRLIWKASWANFCHLRAHFSLIGRSGRIWGHLGPLLGLLGPNVGLPMDLRACKNLGFCMVFAHFCFSTVYSLSRPFCFHFRRLGTSLGPSWAILGPFWGHLGRTLHGPRCTFSFNLNLGSHSENASYRS